MSGKLAREMGSEGYKRVHDETLALADSWLATKYKTQKKKLSPFAVQTRRGELSTFTARWLL